MFSFHTFRPLTAYETPEATPAAVVPATPPAPAPVATPPASIPTAGEAPWAKDLAAIIPDEAVRGGVDGYIREKWQPRMTQLEQEVANSATARALYGDFQNDPVDTFLSVAGEIFEDQPDILTGIQGLFTPAADPAAPATPVAALPPEQARMLAEWQAEREAEQQATAYATQIAALKAAHPEDTLIDEGRLAPFVVSANGDIDAAYAGFRAFIAEFPGAQPAAVVAPPAPAVLGTSATSGGGPTPPTATRYASLDAALDDAMVDLRASREAPPTVVGSV